MSEQIVVDFGVNGNGERLTRGGWSNPEPILRWMVGLESVLVLPRPPAAARYSLWLTVQPHVRPPALSKQSLIVALNDVIVCVAEVSRPMTINCEVPRYAFELADELTIRLIHPNAASPRQLANVADDRLLSIAVELLELRVHLPISFLTEDSEPAS